MGRKITIDPVTRVEGHGKVTIKLDDQHKVIQSRLHIVEFRGFERFVQGRPFREAPVLVQRLCGICPVSHHLAAAKAMDVIVGAGEGDGLSQVGDKMRRLMHYGQFFQSHVLHFFHLVSPDLLFGVNALPETRNVFEVAGSFPELAKQGVMMRKFGQEIIEATAGKKIHGTGAVPGGVNKCLTSEQREHFLNGPDPMNIDCMIDWASGAIDFFKDYHKKNAKFIDNFAAFPSNHLSMVRSDGALDIYHGVLRAVDANGKRILNDVSYQEYHHHIAEEVRSWTYMKFPYLKHLGKEQGWYRVGPLARLNVVDFIPTAKAQAAFLEYKKYTKGKPSSSSMHMHWARLIEVLHAAEMIKELLLDPALSNEDLIVTGSREGEGVGVIEAPRGTLFHHYKVNSDDLITMCNLIVSTTSNNEPMNRAVAWVAENVLAGHAKIPEGMLNQVEVAIRAYDPCLSCATHAMGKMPLKLKLVNQAGVTLDEQVKGYQL